MTAPDCHPERPHYARKMCKNCYSNAQYHGIKNPIVRKPASYVPPMEEAACADDAYDPELWFTPIGKDEGGVRIDRADYATRKAKQICNACPVKAQCLDVALSNERTSRYRWGIWGGLTPAERDEVAKERRAA